MSATIVAVTGGVGGAKLALGLDRELPKGALSCVVNVGDDFDHLGLRVCPDLDTLLYTLSGEANETLGWGRREESWNFLDALSRYGGEDWFRLGDRDLSTHVLRTAALASGESLTAVMARLASALGVASRILPVTDDPLRTVVDTDDGALAFQHYFVRERCEPSVRGFRFEGAETATLSAPVADALRAPDLGAVVLCPSNPFVSIDPVLATPGMRDALRGVAAPVIAVSPLVGGDAVKGPTAKMMDELGVPRSAAAVAAHYGTRRNGGDGILDAFVVDEVDAAEAPAIEALGLDVLVAPTLMRTLEDRTGLARRLVDHFVDHVTGP